MTVSFTTLLVAAWRTLRRSADTVTAVAGMFVFLPAYAALLLCDPIPALPETRDEATMAAWIDAVTAWGQNFGLWFLLADLIGILGVAAIALLLLSPKRPTAQGALRMAAARAWPFLLASMIVALPVGLGLWLFVLPGLYIQARLIAAVPVLARRDDLGAWQAIRVSAAMTRGHGWGITGALVTLFLMQWIVVVPLMSADEWLRAPGHGNPLLLALVDAGVAGVGAAYAVATMLVGAVFYRLRVNSGT
ncbi:hypothetical protein [Sphingomonas adhaesiva]|uniref:hypothetical protein n=1 Tax=Sphingomonas adhaesiva TaxID=28212 RepID=UPI002FF7E65E